jgi:REP element-mobilizing transposase RayT
LAGGTPPLQAPPLQEEGAPPREHKGWHVPRALPHFDSPEIVQAITFRLADALPRGVVLARKDEGDAARRRRSAAALDAGRGACLLSDPALAGIVEAALLGGVGSSYEMFAWVIMPNHVHALIAPAAGSRLADILHAWKSWTAKAINRDRGAEDQVWQKEYFDRFIRDERHFSATVAYIEENPVRAGLAAKPGDWRFSSARRREGGS